MASKFAYLLSKRAVLLALSVAFAVAMGKAGHQCEGYGFFDGPR